MKRVSDTTRIEASPRKYRLIAMVCISLILLFVFSGIGLAQTYFTHNYDFRFSLPEDGLWIEDSDGDGFSYYFDALSIEGESIDTADIVVIMNYSQNEMFGGDIEVFLDLFDLMPSTEIGSLKLCELDEGDSAGSFLLRSDDRLYSIICYNMSQDVIKHFIDSLEPVADEYSSGPDESGASSKGAGEESASDTFTVQSIPASFTMLDGYYLIAKEGNDIETLRMVGLSPPNLEFLMTRMYDAVLLPEGYSYQGAPHKICVRVRDNEFENYAKDLRDLSEEDFNAFADTLVVSLSESASIEKLALHETDEVRYIAVSFTDPEFRYVTIYNNKKIYVSLVFPESSKNQAALDKLHELAMSFKGV